MKPLGMKGMKTLKVFHLIFVMMWTVGVALMGLLYIRPSASSLEFLFNQEAAQFVDDVLVIPGAMLAVVTGIIYGLKTKWGFFKYRWITVKWILGIAIILIGTFALHPVSLEVIAEARPLANVNETFPIGYFGPKLHIVKYMAFVQAAGLLFLVAVSVFKPWIKKTY